MRFTILPLVLYVKYVHISKTIWSFVKYIAIVQVNERLPQEQLCAKRYDSEA